MDNNSKPKGIDDLLVLGRLPTELWGDVAQAELDRIGARLEGEQLADGTKPTLQSEGREPARFPVEVYPPVFRDFITSGAERLQCPPDFFGVGVLAALSRAVGTTRVILADHGYRECAAVYAAIVAQPGTMKTTIIKKCLAPVLDYQKKLSARWEKADAEHKAYLKAVREAKEGTGEMPRVKVSAPRPLEHVYSTNFTMEGLIDRLHDNLSVGRHDSAVLLYFDEIKGWVNGLNVYRGGKGADRQFFLSGWSCEQYKGDRKMNKETTLIERPMVTVFGAVQPDVLRDLDTEGGKEDGFLHRILFSYPRTGHAFRPALGRPVPGDEDVLLEADEHSLNYAAAINVLLLSLDNQLGSDGKPLPPVDVKLTEEAWELWNDWQHRWAAVIDAEQRLSLKGAYSKLRGYAARFALLLHFARVSVGEKGNLEPRGGRTEGEIDDFGSTHLHFPSLLQPRIDRQDIENAIRLVEYFREHYHGAYEGLAFSPADRRVEEFVTWAAELPDRANDKGEVVLPKGHVSTRELYRPKRLFGIRGKDDAEKLFYEAKDRGYGHVLSRGNKTVFVVGNTQEG